MVSVVESYLFLIFVCVVSWFLFYSFAPKTRDKKKSEKSDKLEPKMFSVSTQTLRVDFDPTFFQRCASTQTEIEEEKKVVEELSEQIEEISESKIVKEGEQVEIIEEKTEIEEEIEMMKSPEVELAMDSSTISFEEPMMLTPSGGYDDFGLFDRIGMEENRIDSQRESYRDSILIDEDDADIDSEGEGEVEDGWEICVPFDDSDDESKRKTKTSKRKSTRKSGEEDGKFTAEENFKFLRKSVMFDLEEKKKKTIDHILREMRTTEETFISDLDRVFKRYITPLKRQSGVVKNTQIFSMFAKLGMIRNINSMFLEDLKKVISLTETNVNRLDEISVTIYSFSQTFKLYADYVTGFNEFNIEIGQMMSTNKKFSGFCQQAQRELLGENSRIQDLPSFLITPIQRIPRLNLMMRDLLKIVGTDFKEHENLAKAAKIIADMAKYSNDKTREAKNNERIRVLEKELRIPDLLQPHRKLICEIVAERIRKSGKVLESHVALFSDFLIVYPVKRPIDLTFTMFKEPYICNLTDPQVKVRLIDETTLNIDYKNKDGILKNVILGFRNEKEGIEFYNQVSRQVKKKRVTVEKKK